MSAKELGVVALKSIGITAVIMLLFYRSIGAGILFPVIGFLVFRQSQEASQEAAKARLQEEFLHGIGVLNSSLQAGLSMENAWKEVEKETRVLYGKESEFYLEIKEMNQRVAHNMPIEKLFLDFAYRCRLEDIIQFAELLEFGKRSGSNWKKIIDVTANQMTEQQEAKQQIEVMVAEKKMEQQVMNVMPLGLLAFLQFSAWDYMAVLYHNWFGVICMTIFLVGYVAAIILSQKILKVEL
ncbi:MAG: hypothetical protein IJE49_01350 [Agathobacter sp.]|nr:hypothetical protein [Agathobacter sp.]